MSESSHNRDSTVNFEQATVPSPPLQRQMMSPDESEQTRWNQLLTRGIGDYVLKGILGRGTFGTVYRAYDEALDRDVAIKVLNNPLDSSGMELFQQEARVIAALGKHPAVVQIHQWGEVDGCPYFVLEYIEFSASDLLRKHPTGLPREVALRIVRAASEGMAHAHRQGILHRDIKPANILLEDDGRTVKLADFGLAHLQNPHEGADKGSLAGSPPYMSPEQIECRPLDGRADIFSLGVTLYQLLSGKLPFGGRTASELFQNIRQHMYTPLGEQLSDAPQDICDIVAKATAHDPDDRYQTGDELADAISQALGDSHERLVVTEKIIERTSRRHKLALIASVAVIAVLGFLLMVPLGIIGGENPVLAQARDEMDKGDYEAAQNLYLAILQEDPGNPDALYGQGFLNLLRGRPQDAATAFEAIPEMYALRLEGLAAVAAEEKAKEAMPVIVQAKSAAEHAYPDVLLARMELLEQNQDAVIRRLERLTGGDFYFGWQYAEALQLLGQAYYGMKAFDKAQEVFSRLQAMNSQQQQRVADQYLQMINLQMNAMKSEEIREAAGRIAQMLKEGKVTPVADPWTSRPVSLFILPPDQPVTPYALETGLADTLPTMLGDELDRSTNLNVVNRELMQAILAEQELSAQLSTQGGQLQLGNVMGARLILKPKFLRVSGKDQIYLMGVDVETTENRPVEGLSVEQGGDPNEVVAALVARVQEMANRQYPLQARLYRQEEVPYINIGADMGLEKDVQFEVFADPELPPLANAQVVIDDIGAGAARVRLEGLDISELPDTPEQGWYVKKRA